MTLQGYSDGEPVSFSTRLGTCVPREEQYLQEYRSEKRVVLDPADVAFVGIVKQLLRQGTFPTG